MLLFVVFLQGALLMFCAIIALLRGRKLKQLNAAQPRALDRWYVAGSDALDEYKPSTYVVHLRRTDADNYMLVGEVDISKQGWEDELDKVTSQAEDVARTLNAQEAITLAPAKRGCR
jgi:hypothetical protein